MEKHGSGTESFPSRLICGITFVSSLIGIFGGVVGVLQFLTFTGVSSAAMLTCFAGATLASASGAAEIRMQKAEGERYLLRRPRMRMLTSEDDSLDLPAPQSVWR